MSEFAFFRFKSANMLSEEEERDKQEMISRSDDGSSNEDRYIQNEEESYIK